MARISTNSGPCCFYCCWGECQHCWGQQHQCCHCQPPWAIISDTTYHRITYYLAVVINWRSKERYSCKSRRWHLDMHWANNYCRRLSSWRRVQGYPWGNQGGTERIGDIIQDIIAEREDIARIARDIYNNLTFLNELLEIFGEEPQTSLTKARKLFKTKIFINIYDLCYGMYNKRTTKELLRKDLQKKPERRFPLQSVLTKT